MEKNSMSDFNSLQAVADRQAITDLIYRYCRSMDRIDYELGYSIWHDDAIADYGSHYQGTGRGFIDHVCEHHRHLLYHSHQISNVLIELRGDYAGSESYVTANLRFLQNGQLKQATVWSRYIDQWSKRNGRWGIDKRIALRDFDEIRDITPLSQINEGKRDPSDPSYAVLSASR
jgi:hypothetical protein